MQIGARLVFIHRSIKTRIETPDPTGGSRKTSSFLYIDPLKQGLKPGLFSKRDRKGNKFLYIDPLKQGLKHIDRW